MPRLVSVLVPLFVAVHAAGCGGKDKLVRPVNAEFVADASPESVERGDYLVNTIGACGACHTSRPDGSMTNAPSTDGHLMGGNLLVESEDVMFWIPNITSDVETGLGTWSDDEIVRAIRDGVRKDGSLLFPIMAFSDYQHISDKDVSAIVAYLRSVPRGKPVTARRENKLPGFVRFLLLERGVAHHPPTGSVPEPDRSDRVAYGLYLARVGHCVACHSEKGEPGHQKFMAGNAKRPFELQGIGKVWARNLTPDPDTGLGRYSADQIKQALLQGTRLDGKPMAPPMSMLLPHYSAMSPDDMDAIVAWMKSLPPVKQAIPERTLEPAFEKALAAAPAPVVAPGPAPGPPAAVPAGPPADEVAPASQPAPGSGG